MKSKFVIETGFMIQYSFNWFAGTVRTSIISEYSKQSNGPMYNIILHGEHTVNSEV